MDWMCLLLDAHFTVMVMLPEAKELLSNLHKFVRAQVSCIFWDNYLIFSWIWNMDVEKGGRQKTTNYIGNQIMCVLLYMLFPEHELQLPLSHLDFKSCFVWFKYLELCRATDSSIVWWCVKIVKMYFTLNVSVFFFSGTVLLRTQQDWRKFAGITKTEPPERISHLFYWSAGNHLNLKFINTFILYWFLLWQGCISTPYWGCQKLFST